MPTVLELQFLGGTGTGSSFLQAELELAVLELPVPVLELVLWTNNEKFLKKLINVTNKKKEVITA